MAGLSFELIALQLFTGLALGAIYVLLAVGLSLIFGMLTVVNFAHGAFFMVGAYVGLFLLSHGRQLLALPGAGAAGGRRAAACWSNACWCGRCTAAASTTRCC